MPVVPTGVCQTKTSWPRCSTTTRPNLRIQIFPIRRAVRTVISGLRPLIKTAVQDIRTFGSFISKTAVSYQIRARLCLSAASQEDAISNSEIRVIRIRAGILRIRQESALHYPKHVIYADAPTDITGGMLKTAVLTQNRRVSLKYAQGLQAVTTTITR